MFSSQKIKALLQPSKKKSVVRDISPNMRSYAMVYLRAKTLDPVQRAILADNNLSVTRCSSKQFG